MAYLRQFKQDWSYILILKVVKNWSFSNPMGLEEFTIAQLYKNRWIIEVLFKQIKQSRYRDELKYFLSDNENGIKIQIWVALILNLLFTVLHKKIKKAEDFSTMVMVAAKNLRSYVS